MEENRASGSIENQVINVSVKHGSGVGITTEASYLEGAGLQQGDLVVLGQSAESWDMFGELHHLSDGGGEGQREVLPDLLGGL